MAKAEIFAGNCGYSTEVDASMDGKICRLHITSECPENGRGIDRGRSVPGNFIQACHACYPRGRSQTLHPRCLSRAGGNHQGG